ncbi:MAG TPA: Rne/Rng family ribonuclease [Thermoanaerobaculia bacterium]|nr:Rne/Rng family ribonuclease [Thermoanaerobaculia bacterium]
MRREILVNATPPETRVAVTEDGRAVEVFHERRRHRSLVGNVYLGRVHRVLPGIQAAFVSIGLDRDAFLYVEDAVARLDDFDGEPEKDDLPGGRGERPRIDELVKEGQELVVQVTKDPLSGKGPRVTTNLSLPGRTVVYLPGMHDNAVSRRIVEDEERTRLRRILDGLSGGGGFIARTASRGCGPEDFEADRRYLTELADRIQRRAEQGGAPVLLHRELDLATRAARDLASPDTDAIRVDDEATRTRLAEFLNVVAPSLLPRLALETGLEPLFSRFHIEEQIAEALGSHVPLASGGTVVIHQTEALVAIDVNTGKFLGKDELEETVYATNLEAIGEIARQIRLRDLGGLLVVDFIDMIEPDHRREVFERFQAELAKDRARTRVLQISDFGLIEITRQRSRGNLERILTHMCPECAGTGRVKTDLTVALDLRRELEKLVPLYGSGEAIRARVRPSVLRLVEEEEPGIYADFADRFGIRIELIADGDLPPSGFEILRQ